jgi:hypothetical protein
MPAIVTPACNVAFGRLQYGFCKTDFTQRRLHPWTFQTSDTIFFAEPKAFLYTGSTDVYVYLNSIPDLPEAS